MSIMWNRLKYVLSPQLDCYEQLRKIARGRVADIGFGTGFGMHLLAANAKQVIGYEIDEEALRFARDVFPFKNMSFEYGDIIKGISCEPFNYIIMVDVIEHLKKPEIALKNIKLMMAKGGTFICSTPNRLSRYRKSENHVREFAPKELEGILKRHFVSVSLRNYRLELLASQYENPLLAICRNEETVNQSKREKI